MSKIVARFMACNRKKGGCSCPEVLLEDNGIVRIKDDYQQVARFPSIQHLLEAASVAAQEKTDQVVLSHYSEEQVTMAPDEAEEIILQIREGALDV